MIHLKDYRPPEFLIPETQLHFDLTEERARVRSKLKIVRNAASPLGSNATGPSSDRGSGVLRLHGEDIVLHSVFINGTKCEPLKLAEGEIPQYHYRIESDGDSHHTLCVGVGDLAAFDVEIEVTNEPQKNLACEGLYKSSGMFCTQCEAESFRRITYFVDRPDVMSVFTVTLEADRDRYPILLSNGNRTSSRDLGNGRHEATWHDPFKKPCYLFALVAGDLGCLKDRYLTASGRPVALEIYCRKGLESRCTFAMEALKKSMKWDEDRYGLEYDLDVFMIVVADDFNMGAMENKGLNIFNAHYVLADAATATDHDFANVEGVVGHEYFHNWTGNRVTCRDWFQLSLKEGLTVFRDQEFSADMGSRSVKRIEDVVRLRTNQFAEDSGPMAHPVRPQTYLAIDNFYTQTVYEKGAEVIRMIETLLGREMFRKGMDLYFKLYDGQAVTTDDFVSAMEKASGRDLQQFKNWYDQAGTPVVKARSEWSPVSRVFRLTLEQSCPPSPGQPTKLPFHIPVSIGLLDACGNDMIPTRVLELRKPTEVFEIENVNERPTLSLLRGFSAPVKMEYEHSVEELCFLMANDSDPVARWEATQALMTRVLIAGANVTSQSHAADLKGALLKALAPVLKDALKDPAFTGFLLKLPSEAYIAQFLSVVDPKAVFESREGLLRAIGTRFHDEFQVILKSISPEETADLSQRARGLRSLKNTALLYLCAGDADQDLEAALKQLRSGQNMTMELGALEALNRTAKAHREHALREFKEKWKHEALVINKWLTIRAVAPTSTAVSEVRELLDDPVFDRNNPNKIYSLLLAFARFNPIGFHCLTGEGYRLIADLILDIDARNPQVAARLVSAFNQWKTFEPRRRALMKTELERIHQHASLSNNVKEIVDRALS